MKIQVADVVKVLTIDESGVCKDGREWARCSCLSFFDEEETYIVLTAFGHTAEMLMNNHTGENMRRAFVNGTLEVKEELKVVSYSFNGVNKNFEIPSVSYQLIADTVRFIDRSNLEGEAEAVEIQENEDGVVSFRKQARVTSKPATGRTTRRATVVEEDIDDEEEIAEDDIPMVDEDGNEIVATTATKRRTRTASSRRKSYSKRSSYSRR